MVFNDLLKTTKLQFFKSLFLHNEPKLKQETWYHYSVKVKKHGDGTLSLKEEGLFLME